MAVVRVHGSVDGRERIPRSRSWMSRFGGQGQTEVLVAYRAVGLFEESKSPSLTLLDVALSGMARSGSVRGETGC